MTTQHRTLCCCQEAYRLHVLSCEMKGQYSLYCQRQQQYNVYCQLYHHLQQYNSYCLLVNSYEPY
jgi:hypothetical protein